MEKTLAKVFSSTVQKWPERPAVKTRKGKTFEPLSYRELYEKVREVGTGLIALGIRGGEKVGLISDNRQEWIICDLACVCTGIPDVPRGSNITEQEIEYILGHSDAAAAFVENEREMRKVLPILPRLPGVRFLVVMDPEFTGDPPEGVHRLADVAARGRDELERGNRSFEEALAGVAPGDLATIIYTSGTTGEPKGVMLTHGNLMQNIETIPGLLELDEKDRFLSVLPPWHVFERMVEYVTIASGASTAYTGIKTFAEDMAIERPTFIGSVPRIWDGIYGKIMARMEKEPPKKRKIFHLLVALSKKYVKAMKVLSGTDTLYRKPSGAARFLDVLRSLAVVVFMHPLYAFAQKKFAPVRARTGGALRAAVSGGGALPPHVDEFFAAVGITLLEGYGLTETSPVLALRTRGRHVLGTVGPPLPGTEIKIVDPEGREVSRGEKGLVKCRGAQVMKGYYQRPEETAGAIDDDGWFDTGDLGRMTTRGELSLTGRAKETIVLLGGENVEPTPIEESLKESVLIAQVMVVGQDKKMLGALVVPNFEAVREKNGLAGMEPPALCEESSVQALLREDMRRLISGRRGFKDFERVVRFQLLPEEFVVGRELTLTMKMRRNVITELYADRIEAMYQ